MQPDTETRFPHSFPGKGYLQTRAALFKELAKKLAGNGIGDPDLVQAALDAVGGPLNSGAAEELLNGLTLTGSRDWSQLLDVEIGQDTWLHGLPRLLRAHRIKDVLSASDPLEDEELAALNWDVVSFGDRFYRLPLKDGGRGMKLEELRRFLAGERGIRQKRHAADPLGIKETERATTAIETRHKVVGQVGDWRRHESLLFQDGGWHLNMVQCRILQPAGVDGKTPFIDALLDDNFGKESKECYHFQDWLSHWYRCALKGVGTQGQCLTLTGSPGRGKTLLATGIIGPLMGGARSADEYLLGTRAGECFNGELATSPLWLLDDSLRNNHCTRTNMENILKTAVSRPKHRINPKYKEAFEADWKGRVVILMNETPTALRTLPSLRDDTKDKLSMLRLKPDGKIPAQLLEQACKAHPDYHELIAGKVSTEQKIRAVLEVELPYFAKRIKEWEIAQDRECPRFGVKSYWSEWLAERAEEEDGEKQTLFALLEFLEESDTRPDAQIRFSSAELSKFASEPQTNYPLNGCRLKGASSKYLTIAAKDLRALMIKLVEGKGIECPLRIETGHARKTYISLDKVALETWRKALDSQEPIEPPAKAA